MNKTDKNEVQLNATSRIFYSIDLSGLDNQLTIFYQISKLSVPIDLVYFTTRVPDTNDTSATQITRVQHE